MAAISPETTAKIYAWRAASVAGTLTTEDMKEAIEALRNDRVGASYASTTSRTKKAAAAAPIDTGSLLAGLMAKKPDVALDPEPGDDFEDREEGEPNAA